MAIEIREVAYHRNGVSGLPFWVVLFNDTDEGMFNQLATIDEDGKDCRVINMGIAMFGRIGQDVGMNTWRGDYYLQKIKEAMQEHKNNDLWDTYIRIFERGTRPQCSQCGYEWSACVADEDVPSTCACGGAVTSNVA